MEIHMCKIQLFCEFNFAEFDEYLWITICICIKIHMVIHIWDMKVMNHDFIYGLPDVFAWYCIW